MLVMCVCGIGRKSGSAKEWRDLKGGGRGTYRHTSHIYHTYTGIHKYFNS